MTCVTFVEKKPYVKLNINLCNCCPSIQSSSLQSGPKSIISLSLLIGLSFVKRIYRQMIRMWKKRLSHPNLCNLLGIRVGMYSNQRLWIFFFHSCLYSTMFKFMATDPKTKVIPRVSCIVWTGKRIGQSHN